MGFFDAVGGLLGSGISAWSNYSSARQQNIMSRDVAREQMAFQERMSSTAHQREVEDLRKAGLNPILSAGGGGASSPAGAQPNIVGEIEGVASAAREIPRMLAELSAVRESTRKTKQDRKVAEVAEKKLRSEAKVAEAEAFSAKNRMDVEKQHPLGFGRADAVMRRLGLISPFMSAIGGIAAGRMIGRNAGSALIKPGKRSSYKKMIPVNEWSRRRKK